MNQNEIIPQKIVSSLCEQLGSQSYLLVGEGAFKQVFKIDYQSEAVALKICKSSSVNPRSIRETKILAACKCDGISKLIAAGEFSHSLGKYHYSIEEYIAGGTLTKKIENEGLLKKEDAIDLLIDLVNTLSYMRSLDRSLVHRDIKPDNIMFRGSTSSAVLVDFGLARVIGDVSLTQSWAMMGPGTPFFSAPEQLNNEKNLIDWRTDQFALGITLSFCSLGMHPYRRTTDSDGASEAITRVANRNGPDAKFIAAAESAGLEFLIPMVQPWAVNRFRKPQMLIDSIQKG